MTVGNFVVVVVIFPKRAAAPLHGPHHLQETPVFSQRLTSGSWFCLLPTHNHNTVSRNPVGRAGGGGLTAAFSGTGRV